jgi:hypothetical protein
MLRTFFFTTGVALAAGHGAMSFPRPRNANNGNWSADASCIGDACFWYQVGCFIGCEECTGTGKVLYPSQSDYPKFCKLAEPTNNDRATRTWFGEDGEHGDFTKYNPWRSPGKAPVHDPCGASSGYKVPWPSADVPKGYPIWAKGSEVLPATPPTVWKAGGSAEVSWSIAAQHGGGYAYRLCPKGQALTEECFRAHPLDFVGDTHTIRYNDGSKADLAINATQLSTGVTPEGSTWRRNPIPACNCDIGGYGCTVDGKGFDKAYANNPDPISSEVCKTGTMYPAGFKNGAGGVGYLTGSPVHYSIVDQVQVPSEEGEYVLQWRWDCEETAQVWNSCADIKVSSTEPPTPFPAPAPPAPPGPPPKPKPPTPGKGGCKKGENPTCKGVSPGAASKACFTYGCSKCHDETSYNCDECCDACDRVYSDTKKIYYCSPKKADPLRDNLVEFL